MAVASSETNELKPAEQLRTEELIRRAEEEFQEISTEENENRTNALDDLRFKIGEQWPTEQASQRDAERRPRLTINQLPQFIKDVVNDQRQRRPQIKISTGENGDPDTTKVYDGLVRDIQYCSGADAIYDSALENSVSNGFGYFRILTEYCDHKSFDQQIRLKRIRNPVTVYYGPHSAPDGSDVDTVFVTSWMKRAEFRREYPSADQVSWDSMTQGDQTRYAEWVKQDKIRVVERFNRERKKKTLYLCKKVADHPDQEAPDIITILQGETLPSGYAYAMRDGKQVKRETIIEEVWWHKLTVRDILDSKKLDGKYIPIVPVWGDETDVDGRTYRSGLIRFAKDAARMYNYWASTATELIALAPKAPYIGAEGTFEGHEQKWGQANQVSYPYLEYKLKTLGGQLAPPPARQPFAEMPQGVMHMITIAREDLRTTTGKYMRAELAPRGPEQSGSALLEERSKGELSSFHYVDNLARAIEYAGKIIVDLIPHVYDREMRKVLVRKEDGGTEYVTINDSKTGKKDVRKGTYNVVVSVGPGFSTRRQESSAAKLEFMKYLPPQKAELVADLIVRGMDWEDAGRIADRFKATLPPDIKAMEGDDTQLEELPVAARDAVMNERSMRVQAEQELQKFQQALQEAAKQLDDKNAILATDRYKTDAANAAKVAVAELNAAVKVALDENAKQTGLIAAQVANITTAFGQVSSYVEDLRKREQALAAAEADASQRAAAGPVPSQIDPNAAAGSASPGRGM